MPRADEPSWPSARCDRLHALWLGRAHAQPLPVADVSWMPLLGHRTEVPFSVLDELTAQRNHGQTLAQLARRGGLSPSEALACKERRAWCHMDEAEALARLLAGAEWLLHV